MRITRAIRPTAWALVAAGVAAPALRRRLRLRPAVVLASSGLAPVALAVATHRTRARDAGICALNMWAYLSAYEMPNDDPERLARRVRVEYPVKIDRILGLGVAPTVRLQRAFAKPDAVNRFERVLVWCHWMWFLVPHASVAYVFMRRPTRFPAAAARMYAVFDLGAVFYWSIPTAPPWWAASRGALKGGARGMSRVNGAGGGVGRAGGGVGPADGVQIHVRRMMIEYGQEFWGERWGDLYDVLGGNPLAAMPSLHFATSLMGARLLTEVGPIAGTVGWTYVVLLGVALVYLGEHYAVDLLAGAALTETVRAVAPRADPVVRRVSRFVQALEAAAH